MENQAILKRLKQKQSSYNVVKWEEQRIEHERLMERISKYPIRLYDGLKDPLRLNTESGSRQFNQLPKLKSSAGSLTQKNKPRRNLNTQQDFYKSKQGLDGPVRDTYTSAQKSPKSIQKDIGGLVNLDANRQIFTKRARMLSTGYFLIEVSKKDDQMFYIAAIKKRNSNENYLIELEWDKAKEILKQFRIYDTETPSEDAFDDIIDSLEILDNRLVLLNPKVRQNKGVKKRRAKTRGANSQPRLKLRQMENNAKPKDEKPPNDENNTSQDALNKAEEHKSKRSLLFKPISDEIQAENKEDNHKIDLNISDNHDHHESSHHKEESNQDDSKIEKFHIIEHKTGDEHPTKQTVEVKIEANEESNAPPKT